MRYFFALVFPPLALLLCGKPFQAIFCLPFCCLGWFPGALWAFMAVGNYEADRRNRALMRAGDRNAKAQIKAMDRQTAALERAAREHAAAVERAVQAPEPQPTIIHVQPHQPPPQPLPAPVAPPAAPREPLWTWDDARALASRAKAELVTSYHNLPEWGQPIVWGLAAASPITFLMVIGRLFWR
jgi:uncharacterized membrane protein YqaE (UPF0057 family)